MSDAPSDAGNDEVEDATVPQDAAATDQQDDVFDLDHDGHVSTVEAERARWGVVDARLEEIAEEGGVKGHIAEAAHKIVDKFDND